MINKIIAVMVFLLCVSQAQAKDKELQARIVGGSETTETKYLFTVGIAGDFLGARPFCGGTLINSKWVVTAAHCLAENGASEDNIVVITGCTDVTSAACNRAEVETIYFGEYSSNTSDSDIALLKLKHDVAGAYTVSVADNTPSAGTLSYALGWGLLGENPNHPNAPPPELTTTKLRIVDLPIIGLQKCRNAGMRVTKNMLCAGSDNGGKDTCQGDSGGPLVVNVAGNYTLVGITSTGVGCARLGNYGIYTNVAKFKDGIDSLIATGTSPIFFEYYDRSNASDEPVIAATNGGGGGGALPWFSFLVFGMMFGVIRQRRTKQL